MIDKRGDSTSLTPPPFIEVSVPSKKSEFSCIYVLGVSNLLLSTIFFIGFRNCYNSLVVLFVFICFVFVFVFVFFSFLYFITLVSIYSSLKTIMLFTTNTDNSLADKWRVSTYFVIYVLSYLLIWTRCYIDKRVNFFIIIVKFLLQAHHKYVWLIKWGGLCDLYRVVDVLST
jgi:hypothetical protein